MTKNEFLDQPESFIPLVVDLDGSLISTDTLYEMLILFLRKKPWAIFYLPFWLKKGKQHLKKELYKRTSLDADSLPYRESVVDYLEREKASGRKLILATGSWHEIAKKVCAKVPVFDDYIATDENVNLTGAAKAEWAVNTFGTKGYDYLGNEEIDLVVWREARKSIVVGDDQLVSRATSVSDMQTHLPTEKAGLKTYLKAIRIHQWAKNALIFVPLVTAHQFTNFAFIFEVLIGFICFGFCASATYIINDLLDLAADRKHPIKRNRPLAAGRLSIPRGVSISLIMLTISLVLGFTLSFYFLLTLLAYLVITVLYSFKLKTLQTVDVIALASLFTLRVIAGAAVIEITLSFWLLSFSMFLFLSLAIVKRVSEIVRVANESQDKEKISGRGYFTSDTHILLSLGSSSGFISVLVFALYINSDQVAQMYRIPEILWLMCPILGYWIMRIWMMAARGEMNEDPISFAITDRNSILAGIIMLIFLAAAALV